MKWVFYLLLLANAGFFAVQYHEDPTTPPQHPRALPVSANVNRLLLLSEVNSGELRARPPVSERSGLEAPAGAEPAIPEELPFDSTVADGSCYSIGPLEGDSQVAAVRTWIVAMGGNPILRVGERRELVRYWVYFPPFPSWLEAAQRAEHMRSLGIEDLIVIPKGDMAKAISLGVFSQRPFLDRRMRELREHGYEPSIMPRYETKKASWFDVNFEWGRALDEEDVALRFPGVELDDVDCESGEIARRSADPYNGNSSPRRYFYSDSAVGAGNEVPPKEVP
jgi:hypothetical protein